ncbi:MAG: hypothetical protein FNP40_09235 [Dehalobacter sp. 4CP]|nr:hypothetical protein [Dehalobacter sp. 4CP]
MTIYPTESSPHRLAELEEGRGKMIQVLTREGFAVAVFSWGAISLPEEMVRQLRELVGKEIGILRLDGHYHVRTVNDA